MTKVQFIFASERNAAKLLDLKPADFRNLVDQGHLPKPLDIAGHERWDVEELRHIGRGDFASGMGGVNW